MSFYFIFGCVPAGWQISFRSSRFRKQTDCDDEYVMWQARVVWQVAKHLGLIFAAVESKALFVFHPFHTLPLSSRPDLPQGDVADTSVCFGSSAECSGSGLHSRLP